jgi:hypothetical protein
MSSEQVISGERPRTPRVGFAERRAANPLLRSKNNAFHSFYGERRKYLDQLFLELSFGGV